EDVSEDGPHADAVGVVPGFHLPTQLPPAPHDASPYAARQGAGTHGVPDELLSADHDAHGPVEGLGAVNLDIGVPRSHAGHRDGRREERTVVGGGGHGVLLHESARVHGCPVLVPAPPLGLSRFPCQWDSGALGAGNSVHSSGGALPNRFWNTLSASSGDWSSRPPSRPYRNDV